MGIFSGLKFGVVIGLVGLTLLLLSNLLGSRYKKTRAGLMSFECGFDSFKGVRSVFSLRFFLLAILFLAFDMELILLLFYIWGKGEVSWQVVNKCIFFVGILLIGLWHEINEGSLSWAK
uniref:NADH-ubiquinone oxidoreductase chain 3 n=1 Tax=Hiatella arctica TaxID=120431 RepID=Q06SB5_9BIVA|nr:NADH dehydrogenase subunit 3 [Hiatella arctica]